MQPDSALRVELVRLGAEDQAAREGFGPAMARKDTSYAWGLMRSDSARTKRLREIVAQHGWPTPQLVGKEGVNAAWLVLQHTPDTAFRRRLMPRLDSAAARGELPAQDLATMTDRILIESGKPQRYGTSFAIVAGRMVAHPIEDTLHVDERRAAVGLPPMAEYVVMLKDAYKLPVDWQPKR
ncbi:MAG TPA: DUF6624 domain-containing protein [Gemmatimonadaceae bacterium]